jgi:hypothetical protein
MNRIFYATYVLRLEGDKRLSTSLAYCLQAYCFQYASKFFPGQSSLECSLGGGKDLENLEN